MAVPIGTQAKQIGCTLVGLHRMHAGKQHLLTERLGFRPYCAQDAQLVAALFDDEYARRFYPGYSTPEKALAWIEWNLKNYEVHGFGLWALELLSTGQVVGDAGLTLQEVEGRPMLEIGYHVHHAFRGRGLATEAATACLKWAFSNTRHDTVCSIVHPDNHASICVAGRVHNHQRRFQGKSSELILFHTSRIENG